MFKCGYLIGYLILAGDFYFILAGDQIHTGESIRESKTQTKPFKFKFQTASGALVTLLLSVFGLLSALKCGIACKMG